MKKAAVRILILISALTAFGCASSQQESHIVGKWVCTSSGDRIDVLANHTCTISSMGFLYQGKWTLTGSGIRIEAGQVAMTASFDGKNIVAEDAIMHNKYVYEKTGGVPKS